MLNDTYTIRINYLQQPNNFPVHRQFAAVQLRRYRAMALTVDWFYPQDPEHLDGAYQSTDVVSANLFTVFIRPMNAHSIELHSTDRTQQRCLRIQEKMKRNHELVNIRQFDLAKIQWLSTVNYTKVKINRNIDRHLACTELKWVNEIENKSSISICTHRHSHIYKTYIRKL